MLVSEDDPERLAAVLGLVRYDAVRGNVGAAISEAFLGARSPAAIARISKSSAATVTGGG